MVGTVKISGTFITQTGRGLVQNSRSLYGKYVAEGYQIPEKGFFYTEQLVSFPSLSTTFVTFKLSINLPNMTKLSSSIALKYKSM